MSPRAGSSLRVSVIHFTQVRGLLCLRLFCVRPCHTSVRALRAQLVHLLSALRERLLLREERHFHICLEVSPPILYARSSARQKVSSRHLAPTALSGFESESQDHFTAATSYIFAHCLSSCLSLRPLVRCGSCWMDVRDRIAGLDAECTRPSVLCVRFYDVSSLFRGVCAWSCCVCCWVRGDRAYLGGECPGVVRVSQRLVREISCIATTIDAANDQQCDGEARLWD